MLQATPKFIYTVYTSTSNKINSSVKISTNVKCTITELRGLLFQLTSFTPFASDSPFISDRGFTSDACILLAIEQKDKTTKRIV